MNTWAQTSSVASGKAENLPSDALARLTRGGVGNMHKEVLDEANDG